MGLFDFFKKKEIDTPESFYNRAKLISKTFCQFPTHIDPSLHNDDELMVIIKAANRPDIESDERRKYQIELAARVYELLDKCLAADPEYALALLLYPRVANWNTRAADRPATIAVYERVLDKINWIQKGTKGYLLIEKDIEGYGSGNYFNQVERWLADFYVDLGNLYLSEHRYSEATTQFEKAINLMPLLEHIYCGLSEAYVGNEQPDKALILWEKALTLPFDKTAKQAVFRPRYEAIKDAMRRSSALLGLTGKILPIIEENPAILQKDICKQFTPEEKSDIYSILRTLESEGLVIRKKKGGVPTSSLLKSRHLKSWNRQGTLSSDKAPCLGIAFPLKPLKTPFKKSLITPYSVQVGDKVRV